MVMPTLCQNNRRACVLRRRSIPVVDSHRIGNVPQSMEGFGPEGTEMVDKGILTSKPKGESAGEASASKEAMTWL